VTVDPAHRQHAHRVRLEWGPVGAEALAPVDVAVVVDVLSFTTTLSVAVERGVEVVPFRWRDERAAEAARTHGAVLAVGRGDAGPREGRVTLSPAEMRSVAGVRRIVLPSPNGSTIAAVLADGGATVVGACLRNAAAVARWLAPRVAVGASVAVVPAGERWPDGSLRPAVEDLWGAGAVLAALAGAVPEVDLSVEAGVARAAYAAVDDRGAALASCASGRELVARGYAADVEVAAERDASDVVPVLREGVFVRG
jgi:2-phosphosulfolactate phosphatase